MKQTVKSSTERPHTHTYRHACFAQPDRFLIPLVYSRAGHRWVETVTQDQIASLSCGHSDRLFENQQACLTDVHFMASPDLIHKSYFDKDEGSSWYVLVFSKIQLLVAEAHVWRLGCVVVCEPQFFLCFSLSLCFQDQEKRQGKALKIETSSLQGWFVFKTFLQLLIQYY